MNQQLPLPAPPADPATQAFTEMRNTLATLECAIKEMAGERKALVIPDYSETLEEIAEHIAASAEQLSEWADKPALKLTPEAVANAISKAGTSARAEDHAALGRAIKAFDQSEKAVTGALASARTAADQDKRLKRVGLNCTIAGMVIWAIFPGMVIRAMPESWHLSERVAAWTIGGDRWDAGDRLQATVDPRRSEARKLLEAATFDSREPIEKCLNMARRTNKVVECRIVFKP